MEARSSQLQLNLETQYEESDPNLLVEEAKITNQELESINDHMVQFYDELISMTVQRNDQERWVSFKYNDSDTLHSHNIHDYADEVEVSLFEPQPNLGIECEECDSIPSAHYTELDDDEY